MQAVVAGDNPGAPSLTHLSRNPEPPGPAGVTVRGSRVEVERPQDVEGEHHAPGRHSLSLLGAPVQVPEQSGLLGQSHPHAAPGGPSLPPTHAADADAAAAATRGRGGPQRQRAGEGRRVPKAVASTPVEEVPRRGGGVLGAAPSSAAGGAAGAGADRTEGGDIATELGLACRRRYLGPRRPEQDALKEARVGATAGAGELSEPSPNVLFPRR